MNSIQRSLVVLGTLLLCGCAIRQTVTPISVDIGREVCIVRNDDVRESFLEVYQQVLEAKGYRFRVVTKGEASACPVTSTYRANWSWDLALYMSYAQIKVYKDRREIGTAEYDSTRGSANLGKFIGASGKIEELVDQLFPGTR